MPIDIFVVILLNLLILLFFSLFNQLHLFLFTMMVHVRAGNINKLKEQKNTINSSENIHATFQIEQHDLSGYWAFSLDKRSVIAYNASGTSITLKYRSLKDVKRILENDPRYFFTGGWILRYDGIDRKEEIPQSRGHKIYLKNTRSNFFVLNKNDKKRFTDWYESISRKESELG